MQEKEEEGSCIFIPYPDLERVLYILCSSSLPPFFLWLPSFLGFISSFLPLLISFFLSFSSSLALSSCLSCISSDSQDSSAHVLVDYEEVPSLSVSQRVALYLAADVFLLTTVREGLNLYPLEYICSRRQLG